MYQPPVLPNATTLQLLSNVTALTPSTLRVTIPTHVVHEPCPVTSSLHSSHASVILELLPDLHVCLPSYSLLPGTHTNDLCI